MTKQDNIEKAKEVIENIKSNIELTPEQVAELEALAKEQFEYDKKYPHRHRKYNRFENAQPVACHVCKKVKTDLFIATTQNDSSFKKAPYLDKFGNIKGHKKLRNERPVLDKSGNKMYYCKACLLEEVKKQQGATK